MPTVASVIDELKAKGSEKTRATYVRHGAPADRTFGVSMADLKTIAKGLKGQQALACELYATGNQDAMYLAGIVASGALMTREQLQSWAEGAEGVPMIFVHTVSWVAVENAEGRELALEWMRSKKEHVATAGWATYSGLLATQADEALDLAEIEKLLAVVVAEVHGAKNRVKSAMNGFVIAVGAHVTPLLKQAKTAAQKMGPVSIDVGDTACEVLVAADRIAKIEDAGKVGKKRKTIRC